MNKNKLLIIILTIIICIIITQPSFAKSKLKTKLSNFFQKIEKKLDKESSNSASQTVNIKPQKVSVPVIVASTTKKLNLEDFGLLPQNQIKIKKIFSQRMQKCFDTENEKYYNCQGFTTDGEYFYVVLLNKDKELYKHTKILKIRISDLKIVKQQDLGQIGHSNSLTYNPRTKKIYVAPLWKEWKCFYEFDTKLENLREVKMYNIDGSIIKDQQIRSVTYLPSSNQYIVKFREILLGYFDSEFKLVKIIKLKKSMGMSTTQALSTDGQNLFSVTNDFQENPPRINSSQILVYDKDGNYIDKYEFDRQLGVDAELEQVEFSHGKCYGLVRCSGNFIIYEFSLRKEVDSLGNKK